MIWKYLSRRREYQTHKFKATKSKESLIPPLQKMASTLIAAMTVRLEEIDDEVVKASEAEVVAIFNPLRSSIQIEDKLNMNNYDCS